MIRCQPPDSVKTIDEFLAWQDTAIRFRGTFLHQGTAYQVLMGPGGGLLPSGPAAYVFTPDGIFIDWTADMGDLRTVRNGFDLSSGHVNDVVRE